MIVDFETGDLICPDCLQSLQDCECGLCTESKEETEAWKNNRMPKK